MIAWETRSHEERALLNPAFCANLLWHAAKGRASSGLEPLTIEEAFLVLPLVLPTATRECLPSTLKTSLPAWLENNPIEQRRVASRCQALVPFTRTALTFGGTHGFLRFEGHRLRAAADWSKAVRQAIQKASAEVRTCAAKAEFVGKWFANAGNSTTVLALIGVRP